MKNITFESRFIKLKELGRGGFSRVYKVEDKAQDNKTFALKILNFTTEQEDAQEELKVFYKEVSYLKKLTHNSIVHIVEDLLIDKHPAILMELVEGKSLQDIIDEEQILSAEEVMDVARQISAALLACHTFQIPREKLGLTTETVLLNKYAIVHNDISAKNIIKEKKEDGTINYKLIDFGLSYVPSEITSGENMSQGTLEYYPPEKWRGDKVDTRSDIYSFGVVLYQMLAGKVPFGIDDYGNYHQIKLAKKHHLESNLPDLWEKRKVQLLNKRILKTETPDYPYWFQQLIEKCLEKNPKNRFRTGEELNRYYQNGRRGELVSDWPTEVNHEEEDAWLKAYEKNTIEAYQNFVKEYPKSKYVAQANEEIDYLKELERKKKKEQIEWTKAKEQNTIEAYQNFVKEYRNSEYVKEAKRIIKELEKEQNDWDLIQQKNTKRAYKHFIKKYPKSKYAPIALEKIDNYPSLYYQISKKVSKNKIILYSGLGFIILLSLSLLFKEHIVTLINNQSQEEVIAENQETISLVKAYYEAYYIGNDYDEILDNYLDYPFYYNGKEYSKEDFSKILKSNKMLSTYLSTVNQTQIKNKQVNIDSLVVVSKELGRFNVYGTYSFVKIKNGSRPIEKKYSIKDKLIISDRIKGIEKLK